MYVELPIHYLAFQNGLEVIFFYISILSCSIWGSKANCNTEVVQSTAALNTVWVKEIMWYRSFSFASMIHSHYCHLYFKVFTAGFDSGEET